MMNKREKAERAEMIKALGEIIKMCEQQGDAFEEKHPTVIAIEKAASEALPECSSCGMYPLVPTDDDELCALCIETIS